MIVQKLITTTKDVQLDVEGITLLTKEEVEALPVDIRKCYEYWWLRSPGHYYNEAAFVFGEYGDVDRLGYSVDEELDVRPALRVNLKSTNLQIGDKVAVFGYVWTVITENLILCDDIVGESPFRKDRYASDANKYEASDIKKWLEQWYADQVAKTGSEGKE